MTEDYFKANPAPDNLLAVEDKVKEFIQYHLSSNINTKFVLITSGGTTIPLEKNTVRFLDNFSAGTRGAISAEQFLKHGYAVIFLHRQFSRLPFARNYSHSKNCFLDLLEQSDGPEGNLTIMNEYLKDMRSVYAAYHKAKQSNTLLLVEFVSLNEYIYYLRSFCQALAGCGKRVALYLAAAVSDFYLPSSNMSVHKIQSSNGPLELKLPQVPKMLKLVTSAWVPNAYVVSFKLETDADILLKKAEASLLKYGHQMVIANRLQNRKLQVYLLFKDGDDLVTTTTTQDITLTPKDIEGGLEIEELIVKFIANKHEKWCL